MIPIYLRLTNFMSHVNSEIRFDELDPVTLILGMKHDNPKQSNGAGKSAIFDAITWALYEKSRASGSASTGIDSVVRGESDKCEVEFQFLLGKDLYRVVRSRDRKRKKSDIAFQVKGAKKWQSVAADTKKATNNIVAQQLGLDYDVFTNSVLLGQHEASAFANMTSSERKGVVAKILQLEHYDLYGSWAKKRLEKLNQDLLESDAFIQAHGDAEQKKKEVEAELTVLRGKVKTYEKRLAALRAVFDKTQIKRAQEEAVVKAYEDLRKRHTKVSARIRECAENIKVAAAGVKRADDELEELKANIQQWEKRILDIKDERGNASLIKRDISEWTERVEQLDKEHRTVEKKVWALQQEIKRLKDEKQRIEQQEEGVCPTCYSLINAKTKQEAVSVLSASLEQYGEKCDKGQQYLAKLTEQLEEAKTKLTEAQTAKEKFNRLNSEGREIMAAITGAKKNFESCRVSRESALQHKQQNANLLSAAQNELQECIDALEKMGEPDRSTFEQLTRDLTEKGSEIKEVEKLIERSREGLGGLQNSIEMHAQIMEKIANLKKQRQHIDEKRRVEKALIQAFSKTGIQALILENSAVEIERIANHLLSRLTDSNVSIQIQTQKQNQDGSFKEVFDIIITDEYHSSPFPMYSGGEKFRIAFVVRMALSILLSRRAGTRVSAIFYDEAFQDLDEDGIDKMMSVFNLLTQDFRHQLVITHMSQLKNYFNDILVVNKSTEGSFVSKK